MRLSSPLFFGCVAFLTTVSSLAQSPPLQPDSALPGLSRSFEEMVSRVSPSVVQIIARGLNDRSAGSGVIVDPDGYIVTNAHVVGLSRRIQVLVPVPLEDRPPLNSVIKPTGKLVPAQLVGLDRETDIAVLKIPPPTNVRTLKFGDSESLRQGQLVFAFGSPFGLQNSVSMGIVSSPARQVQRDGPMIFIQTDAPINPGNSGGPLVDTGGALVGINTFIVSPSGSNSGVGFAAPSNIVRNVYEQIRKTGNVRRGHIGVKVQTVTPELASALQLKQDWGVILADVARGSSAEAAGLEIKDVLLTLDGKVLENARQFEVNVYGKAGETIALEILRGADKITKKVAVLERPSDREQLMSKLDGVLVAGLGIFAVELDEKVTPLLPPLRRLAGVVVAGIVSEPDGVNDAVLPGDVIYAINGTPVVSIKELQATLASLPRDAPAAVQVERAGELQFAVVELR